MATNEETDISDKCKKVIEDLVATLGFKDHKIIIVNGSNKGDNYMSKIFKIKAEGTNSNEKKNAAYLFMKKAPTTPWIRKQLSIQSLYIREKFVYTKILPVLSKIQEDHNIRQNDRFTYVKFYDSIEDEMEEVLIMEDISADGYVMYDRLQSLDYDHLSMAIKNLAQFHSTSIVLKAENSKIFDEIASKGAKISEFVANQSIWVNGNIKLVEAICYNKDYKERIVDYLKNSMEDMNRLLDGELTAPYNVICHGDCWSNNFLFKYENNKIVGITMVDWQIMRCTTPVTDIAYLIFTGTDKNIRKKHYKELLDLYYETLSSNVSKMGVDINEYYPERIYREHLKKYMNYGLMIALCILPLALSIKGETPELKDIFDTVTLDSQMMSMKLSKYCVERLIDVVEDCIEYGII